MENKPLSCFFRFTHITPEATRLELEVNGWPFPHRGYSFCRSGDQFVKAVGRRKALTKLLKANSVPRGLRTLIWRAYFQQHSDLRRHQQRSKHVCPPA